MDPGLQALLSFIGGALLSAAGFGWWSAAKYYGLKIEFQKEISETRNRFDIGISETRHRFAGTLAQMRVWAEEENDLLAARIKELELDRARKNGVTH